MSNSSQQPDTRIEVDALGDRVELQWEIQPTRHWWGLWTGTVNYRILPADDHMGTVWMECQPNAMAWTRRCLERKLLKFERQVLNPLWAKSIKRSGPAEDFPR